MRRELTSEPKIPVPAWRGGIGTPIWLLMPAALVLGGLFGLPLVWLVRYSLVPERARPEWFGPLTFHHYVRFLGDGFYLERVLWLTVRMALTSSLIAMVIGYPLAYWIAHQRGKLKALLLAAVLGPLWLNTVIRVFGIMLLLFESGPANAALIKLGLLARPLNLLYNETGVVIGLTHLAVPFFVVSLVGVMENLDPHQREAAYSLGGSGFSVFRRVIFPATLPGVMAGFALIFAINVSAFAIPALLGGNRIPMLGVFIYQQAMVTGNLPFGAAMGLILLVTSIASLALVTRLLQRVSRA